MKKLIFMSLITAFCLCACGDDDVKKNNDTKKTDSKVTVNNNGKRTSATQTFGDPCYCEPSDEAQKSGIDDCSDAGFQRPNTGKILGCDNMIQTLKKDDEKFKGVAPACLRSSHQNGIKPDLYFSNGMCTMMITKCDGDKDICDFGQIGNAQNYDSITACPDDSKLTLVQFDIPVELTVAKNAKATLHAKACFPNCTKDSDCRDTEYDSLYKEKTQRKCVEVPNKQGTKICADPRIFNLK